MATESPTRDSLKPQGSLTFGSAQVVSIPPDGPTAPCVRALAPTPPTPGAADVCLLHVR